MPFKPFFRFLGVILSLIIMIIACISYISYQLLKPQIFDKPIVVEIKKNQSTLEMAKLLQQKGVLDYYFPWVIGAKLLQLQKRSLKFGEYEFQPKNTAWDFLQQVESNRVLQHTFTLVEGKTVEQIRKSIKNNTLLSGTLSLNYPEGQLLPDTYHFVRGETKDNLLKRMHNAYQKFIESLKTLELPKPIENLDQLIVLASIVEKETAIPAERPIVAAVYLNRLKIKMKLQADPTVVYGITAGQNDLDRALLYADLRAATPYNTYVINGLPPTPIACSGRETILATLKPAPVSYLYFVADGTGGHKFSNNYAKHQTLVQQWRIINKKIRAQNAD